jgi:hypothetical protein
VIRASVLFLAPVVALVAEEKKEEPAAASTLADLETELKAAMSAGQMGRAGQLVDEIAAVEGAEACSILIKHALSGADYDLERQAGAILGSRKDPGERAVIIEALRKSPNWKTRIILLAVAARMEDSPEALAAIHGALKDPIRQVVFAALSWIREIGRLESVDPLIDELQAREGKPRDRIYFDIQRLLKAFTGLDLESAAEWRSAWAGRKGGAGLSPFPERKKSATVVYKKPKPRFFAMDIESDKVLFIIDISQSMLKKDPPVPEEEPRPLVREEKPKSRTSVARKEPVLPPAPRDEGIDPESLPVHRQRIMRVKTELSNAITALPPETRFGILAFSHQLDLWGGSRVLRPATQENKANAVSWVRALRAQGATRTDLALEEALSLPEVDSIFLLTDGAPQDFGDGAARLAIDPILADTKRQNRFLKCRIHTISFRQIRDYEMREFVRLLAWQNDGECKLLD